MKAKKKKAKLAGRIAAFTNSAIMRDGNNKYPGCYTKPGSQK